MHHNHLKLTRNHQCKYKSKKCDKYDVVDCPCTIFKSWNYQASTII